MFSTRLPIRSETLAARNRRALWGCGGIGRRARLRIWCPQGRVGSNPTFPTMGLNFVKKTYEHNYGEHMTIILKEMCNRVGADYNKLPLEDHESFWFTYYTWSKEQEKDYENWLANYMYNTTKARRELMSFPWKTKKQCRKFAEQFVSWYGWKTARMAELADAPASKAGVREDV